MAIIALNTAATGLKALSTRIDVLANNLANAETTAFKRSRANFEDLMYLNLRQPGTTNSAGDASPTGVQVGLGTKLTSTQIELEQGSQERTDVKTDVAIQGSGFFRVQTPASVGGGIAYTRAGNLVPNNDGELVVDMNGGYRLQPTITMPADSTDLSISQDGVVSVIRSGQNSPQVIGQIELTQFVNPVGLRNQGGNMFTETEASGPPINGKPAENGTGVLLQGFLEGSNVDAVKELVTLIRTQRSFELNSQAIQTADQALQTIGNLRRG